MCVSVIITCWLTCMISKCGTFSQSAELLTARRLKCFGHVVRMDEVRVPQGTLYCTSHGVGHKVWRGAGRQ